MKKQKQLTPIQNRCIELLLAGHSVVQIASAVAVNRATIAKWIVDDAFSAELRQQQATLYATGLGLLLSQLDATIGNIVQMSVNAEDEPTRLRANIALIDKLLQLRNQNDLEQRLTKLETLIEQREQREQQN